MNSSDIISLPELETLFHELIQTEQSQNDEFSMFFSNLKHTFMTIVPKLHVEVEPLLQFIDRYTHHKNWRIRLCVLVFIQVLQDFRSQSNRFLQQLNARLWGFVDDSDRRLVEFLAHHVWGTARPTPREHVCKSLDLSQCISHLQHLLTSNWTVGEEYFVILVEIIRQCVDLERDPQLKPFIRQLIELTIAEDLRGDLSKLSLLDLLHIWWRFPPPRLEKEWFYRTLDLIHEWFESEDDELMEILDDLGHIIAHYRELELLDRTLERWQLPPYDFGWFYFEVGQVLFPHTLEAGWGEGMNLLIGFMTEMATYVYTSSKTIGDPSGWSNTINDWLTQSLNAGNMCDLPLLEKLVKFYDETDEAFSLGSPLPPALNATMIRLGELLEQQRNESLRDFCLNKGFLPPVYGMLKHAIQTSNVDWTVEILSALLVTSFNLNLHDVQKLYQYVSNRMTPAIKSPLTPTYTYHDYLKKEQKFTAPPNFEANLYILGESILQLSRAPRTFKDTILTRLFTLHGTWILRLLCLVIYYTCQTTTNCVPYLEAAGTLGLARTDCVHGKEVDVPWLLAILQGCVAHPEAQALLTRYISDPATPLFLRKLMMFALIRYGPEILNTLLPLHKWFPKSLRVAAAYVLGYLKDSRAVPSLINNLHSNSSELRLLCAWALGEIKDPQAIEPLLSLLQDPDLEVQLEGMYALKSINDPRATPYLLERWKMLEDDSKHIGERLLITGGDEQVFFWYKMAALLQEVLQQFGIHVPTLTEKKALKAFGIPDFLLK